MVSRINNSAIRATEILSLWFAQQSIGGSRGAPLARAPLRVPILSFWHKNFRNVTASGVHTPSYEVHAPLREILDLSLQSNGNNVYVNLSVFAEYINRALI